MFLTYSVRIQNNVRPFLKVCWCTSLLPANTTNNRWFDVTDGFIIPKCRDLNQLHKERGGGGEGPGGVFQISHWTQTPHHVPLSSSLTCADDDVNSGVSERTGRHRESISSLVNNFSPESSSGKTSPTLRGFQHRHGCTQVGGESHHPEPEQGETVVERRQTQK